MSDLEVHPVADLFPMLAEDELAELADDIKQRGLLQPIVLDADGRVLDGRNRLAACRMAGVEPDFVTYNGDDPDGYAVAVNIARRHLSKGQKAAVMARSGYKNYTEARVSKQYVSWARQVDEYAKDLLDRVIAGRLPLREAYEEVLRRKREDEETRAKVGRLRESAPDLLLLVEEERMSLDEATSLLDARIAKEEALRSEQEQKERLAYQQALNAYNNAVDGLTTALSYAQAYTPPKDIPDNYLSVSAFKRRVNKLLELIEDWSDE